MSRTQRDATTCDSLASPRREVARDLTSKQARRLVAAASVCCGLYAAMFGAGCERTPSGPLQLTVPSGSPPPTPAFATNSVRTSGDNTDVTTAPTQTTRVAAETAPGASNTAATAGASSEGACSAAGLVRAKRIDDQHFELARQDFDGIMKTLQDRSRTATTEQLSPVRTQNGLPGLQVRGIGANAECGIESDDILVTVNGISVTDQRQLSKERDRLRAAEQIELQVERSRKIIRLQYDIRE